MTPKTLPCVEVETAPTPELAVIWLHGLGADGHDFEPLVPMLRLPRELRVRFVFPHAPSIPVTVNSGMVMPAWYDIRELGTAHGHDAAGIERSADALRALVAREGERGIPSRNVLLAGFSQGGAIATHVALRHPERLAGLMALSTYLVLPETLEGEIHRANRDLPVFQAHGTHDPMVPLARGEELQRRLRDLGYSVEWHTWPMGHEVCAEEIAAIGAWLRVCLEAAREAPSEVVDGD